MGKRDGRVAVAVVLAALAVHAPASAPAAVVIGQAPPVRGNPFPCNFTAFEAFNTSPAEGPDYVVPAGGGVITEWRHFIVAAAPLGFRVYSPQAGESQWQPEAQSEFTPPPTPLTVGSMAVRIPVQAGWRIGVASFANQASCLYDTNGLPGSVDAFRQEVGFAPLGSPATYPLVEGKLANVAAVVEPDGDGDGFGDESQDACPGDPEVREPPCPDRSEPPDSTPPETTISQGPKRKTKRGRAVFTFTSSEPGSTFECSLDGAAFSTCASPHRVKARGVGQHGFLVRSRDSAGNVDPTEAAYSWKLRKPKRKHRGGR